MMGVMMTAWLLLLILFSFAAPLAAEAQQAAGKVYRLGILSPGGAPDPSIPTIPNLLPAALRAFGYVEGRNLVVDRRFAEDNFDRLPGLARELVQLRPDVIVAVSSQAINLKTAKALGLSIPPSLLLRADQVIE